MNRIIIFLSFLLYHSMSAQDMQAYNSISEKTYLATSQHDMGRAIKVADSLYQVSETPLYKTRSLLLSASLYQQAGDIKKAVDYALKAEGIIEHTNDYIWQTRVYGFLATQYRILKLYGRSKQYLDKAFKIIKKIENPKLSNSTMGLMLQEMAYVEIDQKNYRKSIEDIQKAQKYFELMTDNLDFFTADNEQLLGLNYYHLQDLEQATVHYEKALTLSKKMPESYLNGLIYNGFALIYLEKNELPKAKKYLDLAQAISDKSSYLYLKNEISTTSQKYYTVTKDLKNLALAKKNQDSIVEQISSKSSEFINDSISNLDNENTLIEKKSINKTYIILLFSTFIIGGIGYFILYRKKQKENLENFKRILKDLDSKLNLPEENATERPELLVINHDNLEEPEISTSGKTEVPAMMNVATEEKLLKKLHQFEKSKQFTQNNISLSSLAIYCDTNNKYLSYIINTHKKKDFNNYINDLRVAYIVKKLKENPVYRKYKIAVLAEEAGFSSQNKFATVFKNTTAISPSLFIKYLQENSEEHIAINS